MTTREAAVAGRFYPDDRAVLRAEVHSLLEESPTVVLDNPPKAIIAPHAGYVYSGAVAAAAYAQLKSLQGRILRVVLLGPAHYVAVRGLATTTATAFETPLGEVPVDVEANRLLWDIPEVAPLDAAHQPEHSLEVHLPFLQETLGTFRVVPIVVGEVSTATVVEVLDRLWGGDETLIVVSSDLSHYHDYQTAKILDRETSRAIENSNPEMLEPDRACGCVPIRGLLMAAAKHGLVCHRLDLRNSGDTAGSRDRVVGYGAWAFTAPSEKGGLSQQDRTWLLKTARDAIRLGCELRQVASNWDAGDAPESLRRPGACFVTLRTRNGDLRGCIGSLRVIRPLISDVAHSAQMAALHDPRFPPVRPEEVSNLLISISVLGEPTPLEFATENDLLDLIRPGDGLTLTAPGGHRGTLVPAVWDQITGPREFRRHLKQEASLAVDDWPDGIRVERYTAESFSEGEFLSK